MSIRNALQGEAELLTDLTFRSKASWGYDNDFMESCRLGLTIHTSDIENSENVIRVIETDSTVVGFYFLRLKEGRQARLRFFFIDPQYQRHGFGAMLFADVVEIATKRDISSISIESDPYAEAFYEKMGAVKVGEVSSESIKGRVLPLMEYVVTQ